MISLVLPIYNDSENAKRNMPKIISKMEMVEKKRGEPYEIIVVEESTDSTPDVIENFRKRRKQIKHIHSNMRLGKGGALTKGILDSRGDKIIFMDIDMSTDISAVDALLEKLGAYDMVVGSRFSRGSRVLKPLYRSFFSFVLSVLSRILFGIRVSDTQCGFKGFRRKPIMRILKHVRNNEWLWDIEVFYYAKEFSYTVCEIPVIWTYKKLKSYNLADNIFFYAKNMLLFSLHKGR